MTTEIGLARDRDQVKTDFTDKVDRLLEVLVSRAEQGASPRELEEAVWEVVLVLGRCLLSMALGTACRRSTEVDLESRGLGPDKARLRLDRDYWATVTTTLGKVTFPLFAYRDSSGPLMVTRTPARAQVLPLWERCRSSDCCLEWETRLGAEMPFRRAQEALRFFTHGAVEQHDTTIAAHMVAVGCAIDRRWLYRSLPEVQALLRERATRDGKTDRPIVYVSCDAHAERRYVDDTWNAAWKMVNGLRLWIVDRHNGGIVHLGGEFTWGDCHEVSRIVDALIEEGILPRDGDYGDGLVTQVVVITDGCPWVEQQVVKRLSWSVAVLDLYHALERVASFAALCFGTGTKAANGFYRRLSHWLVPRCPGQEDSPKARRGHTKKRRRAAGAIARRTRKYRHGWCLIGALYEEQHRLPAKAAEAFDTLLDFFEHNVYRMAYDEYAARGLQLGSGAMESLHRTEASSGSRYPAAAGWSRPALPSSTSACSNSQGAGTSSGVMTE